MRAAMMKPLTEKSTREVPRVSFYLNGSGIVTLNGTGTVRTIYAINATDLSIVHHLPADADLTGSDILVLAYVAYLYILKVADTKKMKRYTKIDKEIVTTTRDNVFASFDLVKYKIATLRCVIQRLTPINSREVEKHFVACGLKREDAILYYLLYNNNDVQDFVAKLATIEDEVFTLDINKIAEEINNKKANSEFEKAATYHANRIRFIAASNRFDFIDIRNELKMRSIQAYYWVRPFYSKAHAINYAKRTLQGYSMVLKDFYNKEDRARLIRNEDGSFHNVIQEITADVLAQVDIYEEEDRMIQYLDERVFL